MKERFISLDATGMETPTKERSCHPATLTVKASPYDCRLRSQAGGVVVGTDAVAAPDPSGSAPTPEPPHHR